MAMPIFDQSIALLQTAIMGISLTSFQIRTYVTGFGKTRQLRTKLIIQKNVIE